MRRVKDGTLPVVSIVLPNILKILVIVLPNINWGMIPYHYKWWWFPSIWSGMIKYTMVDESWIVSEILLPNIHLGWFNAVKNPHGMTEGIWTLFMYIKFMITCIKVICLHDILFSVLKNNLETNIYMYISHGIYHHFICMVGIVPDQHITNYTPITPLYSLNLNPETHWLKLYSLVKPYYTTLFWYTRDIPPLYYIPFFDFWSPTPSKTPNSMEVYVFGKIT